MAGLGNFTLTVGVDTSALTRGLASASSQLTAFASRAESTGTRLSLAISTPLALLAKRAIESYGELEALRMSLRTVEGSAANTARRLAVLNEVAKLPGVGFKEAIQGDVRLRTVGISADLAKRSMMAFGNAIAIAGGGKAQFESVINQLTQMSTRSSVLMEDLKPITTAVPAVSRVLQQLYGTIDTEVISAKLKKTGTSTKEFIAQITAELEKLPPATGGVKNAIENLGDSVFKTFAQVGETINKNVGVKNWLDSIGSSLEEAASGFARLSPEAQKAILAISAVAIALPPFLLLAGTILPALQTGFLALLSPINLVGVALGAAAIYAVSHWNKVEDIIYRIKTNFQRTLADIGLGIAGVLRDTEGAADIASAYVKSRGINPESQRDASARGRFMYKKGGQQDLANLARIKQEEEIAKKQKDIAASASSVSTKQEQDRIKAIKDLSDNLLKDRQRAEVEAIANKAERARAGAQMQYNEEVKAYADSINALKASVAEKKPLWEGYTQFVIAKDKELKQKLRENDLLSEFTSKPLKSIGSDDNSKDTQARISAIMGISPDGVDKYAVSLNQRMKNAAKYLQEQGESKMDTNNLEQFLGLAEGTITGDTFAKYAEQANILIDANQRIKESFQNMAADSLASLSIVVGEMIAGTATIEDLANTLLSSISQSLAQIAKQNILIGLFTGNVGMVAQGVLAGIGAGITGGLAKKQQQNQQNSQGNRTVVRGQEIETVRARYDTIKNF